MTNDHFIKIGTFTKPHGVNGEMILRFDGHLINELEEGEPVFVELNGSLVPFFIETIRGSDDKAFLKLEYASLGQELDRLRGMAVFLESKKVVEEISPDHPGDILIGWALTDEGSSFSGIIRDFISEKDNPLLVLEKEGKEYYIPMQEEFIVKMDKRKKILYMDLPEGIFGINE